jgi:hypothetical protein
MPQTRKFSLLWTLLTSKSNSQKFFPEFFGRYYSLFALGLKGFPEKGGYQDCIYAL